ncbi:MAG: B12-binding domain-containing radical SAM protein [Pseudomonadota bacterium]
MFDATRPMSCPELAVDTAVERPVWLLQPPANLGGRKPCLDDQQFGLGLLSLSAWLRRHGYRCEGMHLPLALSRGDALDAMLRRIADSDPLLIAIGMNWVHFSVGALALARRLKALLPQCPIVVGGQHASLFAQEIMTRPDVADGDAIDAVIVGEAELPLLRLCETLARGGGIDDAIPGLVRRGGRATPPMVVEDIDALPPYSYRALQPAPAQPDTAAISTARGACPFRCAWCIEPVVGRVQGRPRLRFHGAEWIADQIALLMAEGRDRFTIQDNFFVGGDRRMIDLSEALRRRGLRPRHLNVFAHPDSYDLAGLQALADCCDRASVDYGVETGSVEVARRNHRRLDPDQVVERVDAAVHCGVEPYTWWMVGLPFEDDAALADTEALIARTMRVGGIPRWVSPLILFPRTPIHDDPVRYGVRLNFAHFEDYARFSETTLTEALLFTDTVTHHAEGGRPDACPQASLRLRRFIHRQFPVLEEFYHGHRLQPDLDVARKRIESSFF